MENQHQKWVNLCYLSVSVLFWYIASVSLNKLVGIYDLETRIPKVDLVVQVASVVCGLILFLILYSNTKSNQFMSEVVVELARVTWPTQKETASATFIVIVMVFISGLFLGFLDYGFTAVVRWAFDGLDWFFTKFFS